MILGGVWRKGGWFAGSLEYRADLEMQPMGSLTCVLATYDHLVVPVVWRIGTILWGTRVSEGG